MSPPVPALGTAHDIEVFHLLGQLQTFSSRVRSSSSFRASSRRKETRNQVCQWYRSLSPRDRRLVNTEVAPQPLSNEIKMILQQGMISDIDFFRSSSLLCWNERKFPMALQFLHRGSHYCETLCRPHVKAEKKFLMSIDITWSSTQPLDFRFCSALICPGGNGFSLMMDISNGECFTRAPDENHDDVKCLKWFRDKSTFCLAELLVAMLEIRIWCCFKNRKKKNYFAMMSNTSDSGRIESELRSLLGKYENDGKIFRQVVMKKSASILVHLSRSDEATVRLYISIMKKRLNNWQSLFYLPPHLSSSFLSLWTLCFFSLSSERSFHPPLYPCPHHSEDPVDNLMVVPLMHSFSLFHEFRMQLRDGLISDRNADDLLLLAPDDKQRASDSGATGNNIRKKKHRKKRKKKSSSEQTEHLYQPSHEGERTTGNTSPNFSHALFPKYLTPNIVMTTQAVVFAARIVEDVLRSFFETSIFDDKNLSLAEEVLEVDDRYSVGSSMNDSSVLSGEERATIMDQCHVEMGEGVVSSSVADGGLYGSFYALPSWVHADYSGPEDNESRQSFSFSDIDHENNSTCSSLNFPQKFHGGERKCPDDNSDFTQQRLDHEDSFQLDQSVQQFRSKALLGMTLDGDDDYLDGALFFNGVGRDENSRLFESVSNPHLYNSDRSNYAFNEEKQLTGLLPVFEPDKMNVEIESIKVVDEVGSNLPADINVSDSIPQRRTRQTSLSFSSGSNIKVPSVSLKVRGRSQSPTRASATLDGSETSQLDDLSTKNRNFLIFALICSNMKSQAEGAVLRNILALQRSFVLYPSNVSQAHHQPYAVHHNSNSSLNSLFFNHSQDMEVMSDDGSYYISKRSGQTPSLATGAATVSSLVFKNISTNEAVPPSFIRSNSMRSVPNSPPILPDDSPSHDDLEVFPPLPTAYPSAYLHNTQQHPQHHRDDEAISYSGRLRLPVKRIEIKNGAKQQLEIDGKMSEIKQNDSHFMPHPSTPKSSSYRPRSASVSRKPQPSAQLFLKSMLPNTISSNNLERLPVDSKRTDTTKVRNWSNDSSKAKLPLNYCAESGTNSSRKTKPYDCELTNFSTVRYSFGSLDGITSPLTREILTFVKRVDTFGAKVQSAKASAILRLRQVVQNLWPRAQVKAFGSYVSGLSLPDSDVDLVIYLPKVHRVAGPSAPGFLEGRNAIKETWQNILARCLKGETWVDVPSMKVIDNTAVPVIKLKTLSVSNYSVSLDISFGGHDHRGVEASNMIVSLIREYPPLRLIVLVLKQFLSRRGLCEVFTGGLSSYAMLLLTTRFLQEQSQSAVTDVGASLLGILEFYGNHLQPSLTGISVANMCYFSRNDHNDVLNAVPSSRTAIIRRHSMRRDRDSSALLASDSFRPYKFDPLFIEDPLDKGNNVGRNCFRIHQVQRIFSDAHKAVLDRIALSEMRGFREHESLSLLNILVGDLDTV